MNFEKLTGLIAATHTPFKDNGSLDLETVARQAAHLSTNGVSGAFITGTTGEGHSLTVGERKQLAEQWKHAVEDSMLKLIVHVGHNCLPDAVELAAHAQEIGSDSIAALAPSYYKPADINALVEWCGAIAAAAHNLPFYFYDIPSWTGVELSMVDFLELGSKRIPNLAGIKYTNTDLAMLQRCRQFADGRFDILFGCDEALLAGLGLGCRGAVGSSYNFAAPIYHRVIAAFEQDDLETAQLWQARSVDLISTIAQYGYGAAAKSVMQLIGLDCGPVRQPLSPISADVLRKLQADLESLGFFDWLEADQPASTHELVSAS